MLSAKLRELLEGRHVEYVALHHSSAFTAAEVAALTHVAGDDFAKTVIVKVDGRLAMVVVPASRRLALSDLADALGAEVHLASESELAEAFPDCEVGAMPPFGNLYGMPVYVSTELAHEPEIAFNAGTHTDAIKMTYADWAALVRPREMPSLTVR